MKTPKYLPLVNNKHYYLSQAIFLISTAILFLAGKKTEAQVTVNWDKSLGGSSYDLLQYQQQTSDGGYILGGTSNSSASGNKSKDSKGQEDFWIIKLDAAGNKQWDKTLGGSKKDFFQCMQQTLDGGYILGGYSNSPISGDKSAVAAADYDYWVIKLDAKGNKQWDRAFGSRYDDFLVSIQQTSDKGYILGGTSNSPAGGKFGMNKTAGSRGEKDYWVVKLDVTGKKEWDRTLGGNSFDFLRVVKQTSDNGYVLGGYSYSPSSSNKTGANKGFGDYWIVKLSARGLLQWNKTIGGSNEDVLQCLEIAKDGSFILGGTSSSPVSGNKTQASRGESDYWIVKMDNKGTIVWDKTIGGSGKDNLRSLKQTTDGGYILGGVSASSVSGNKSEETNGSADFWIVKLYSTGAIDWDKTIGGSKEDGLQSIQQVDKGKYVLGGYSKSSASLDKSAPTKGDYDFWLVNITVKSDTEDSGSGGFYLSTTPVGNGTISRSSVRKSYVNGSVVSLTATPEPGYRFVGWYGAANGVTNPLIVTMNSNKNIIAKFALMKSNIYEAEEADVRYAKRSTEFSGYSGTSYVDFLHTREDLIQWVLRGQEAGNYELTFRYANGSQGDRTLKIMVNNIVIQEAQKFRTTSKWSNWSEVKIRATLTNGINKIRIKVAGDEGPSIDYLKVVTATNAPGTVLQSFAIKNEYPVVAKQNQNSESPLAELISSEGIKAYPNPFKSTTNFKFGFAQEQEYELAIYDLNGTVVKSFPPGVAPANKTIYLSWNAASLRTGIYLAKIKTRTGLQTLRLIKN